MDKILFKLLKKKYPHLTQRFIFSDSNGLEHIQINFHNDRYYAWISDDSFGAYISGINGWHLHYDMESPDQNLADALEAFDDVISEKIAVIGLREKKEDYLLGIMTLEDALEYYTHEKPKVEINTLNQDH